MTIFLSRPPTQHWAGYSIGIMVLDCHYPFVPGNVANATTFKFPVRYTLVEGVTGRRLLESPNQDMVEPFVAAAKRLEAEGVKAITGACGFIAYFQRHIAAAVEVPVFSSSLLQVNFAHLMSGGKRVGIICADSACLKSEHLINSGVSADTPIAIAGMENCQPFIDGIRTRGGSLDHDALRLGTVEVAKKLLRDNSDIGSIVLECSDLPPYAHAVQSETCLPVFDFNTMINYVHECLTRQPYAGYI